MTNFERIKAMSVEQMADWIEDTSNCFTCAYEDCNGGSKECLDGHKLWLQREAEE